MVVIQTSYKREEYKFYFPNEGNVYFNIKWKRSVIQSFFKNGECNLFKFI